MIVRLYDIDEGAKATIGYVKVPHDQRAAMERCLEGRDIGFEVLDVINFADPFFSPALFERWLDDGSPSTRTYVAEDQLEARNRLLRQEPDEFNREDLPENR